MESGIKVVSLTAVFWMLRNAPAKRCMTYKKRLLGSQGWDQGSEARVQESKLWDQGSGANLWDQYHFRPKLENHVLS